ncbi:MAG: hypothetical protein PUJ82_07655 [Spirochaetales bacterium]|nr:hypothetical protein [Spirochaetales bacterium]
MKLEDMKVGALVKCTKPEWNCYGNIFEITKKLPDNEWEITIKPYVQMRQSGKRTKALNPVSIVSQQMLQHNFKLDKQHTVRREIQIVCFADNTTFASDKIVGETVCLYHEDKYDEFVGAVEALAKLYRRKSPFDEIEDLKEAARAAEEHIEATEVSDEWLTVEKEEPKPHSPVDDMDLTPPLEAGCLVEVLKPQITEKGEDVTGAWQYVYLLLDGNSLTDKEGAPRKDLGGIIHARVNDITENNNSRCYNRTIFPENEVKVVKERYRDVWPKDAVYDFGSRVFLNDKSYSSNRKCRGTVFDCKESNGRTYYHVHWDPKNVHKRCDEEWVEGISLHSSLY